MSTSSKPAPRAERAAPPFVMVDSLGPLALSDFVAEGFELLVWRTSGATSYALARCGDLVADVPLDERLVTTPISELGAHVTAFEILAGELPRERLEKFAKTLAAFVFAQAQDTGGIARQQRHLKRLAREHGFGGDV